jgi:hypothetical protein
MTPFRVLPDPYDLARQPNRHDRPALPQSASSAPASFNAGDPRKRCGVKSSLGAMRCRLYCARDRSW